MTSKEYYDLFATIRAYHVQAKCVRTHLPLYNLGKSNQKREYHNVSLNEYKSNPKHISE